MTRQPFAFIISKDMFRSKDKKRACKLSKKKLRSSLLLRLRKQPHQQQERKSRLIEKKLLRQEEFISSERIMFYLSLGGEVKTQSMIEKSRELGKEIYVPQCDLKKKTLSPYFLEKNSLLEAGPYNTLQPKKKRRFPAEKLDLVIVPAVAFDRRGNRLGRGKGYYDRFLKDLPAGVKSIGLAFDFQILPRLPVQQSDVPVEKILSA